MWKNKPLEPLTPEEQLKYDQKEKDDPNPHPHTSSVVDPFYIKLTTHIYLPLMYVCYVWYSVVNIFGLIDYADKKTTFYEYGFYRF